MPRVDWLSLVVAASTLILVSCQPASADYGEIDSRFLAAWKSRDREGLIDVSDDITENEIRGPRGLDFLKLKLTSLTLAGEYEAALDVLNRHIEYFNDDLQLRLAKGLVEYHHSGEIGAESSLREVYEVLKTRHSASKTDDEVVIEYYLALVLDLGSTAYVRETLYRSMSDNARAAAHVYAAMSRDELLQNPPIGFVVGEPIRSPAPSTNERWWE